MTPYDNNHGKNDQVLDYAVCCEGILGSGGIELSEFLTSEVDRSAWLPLRPVRFSPV
jgi:hypothetical protein